MNTPRITPLLALLALGVAGCGGKPAPDPAAAAPAAAPAAASDAAIPWMEGDVNAAFARAAAEDKPVFLYWGASWCPPCHELAATVFVRADFIEKMKLFVPVYIDGDAEGAQKWGDEFRVSGYPSVVVLRADRTELARIHGGMDLNQYAEILDLALGDVQPVTQLLASLGDGAAPLSRDECRRLAYNGWEFPEVAAENRALATQLQQAVQRCPAEATIERSRLIALSAAAATAGDEHAGAEDQPPGAQLRSHVQAVHVLLGDFNASVAAADALQYLGSDFFKAAKRAFPAQAPEMLARWSQVMDAAAVDARYSATDQLAAVGMKLRAIKLLGEGDIPADTAEAARQRVNDTLALGQKGYARAGVVNSSLFVLDTLGDTDRIHTLVETEMLASQYPYYYMLDLASIEEDRGHVDAATAWLERAYRESKGAATRFQWGTEYVLGLLRMQPQNDARIRAATLEVLGELDGPDRIHRRTARRLERLDAQLRTWSAEGDRGATLTALRARRDALCAAIPADGAARKDCEAFLSGS